MNARSIKQRNKLEEIESIIELLGGADILVITETWLKPGMEEFFNIPGFNAEHLCRPEKRGGGLGIYLKNNIDYERVSEAQNVHEIMKIKIIHRNTAMHIIGLYNPPDNTLDNFHDGLLNKVKISDPNTLIIGDFNINALSNSLDSILNLATLESCGYALCNKLPTRITLNNQGTLIDNTFANFYNREIHISNIISDLSDHNLLVIRTKWKNDDRSNIEATPKSSRVDYQKMLRYCKLNKFSSDSTDVDEFLDEFLNFISKGKDEASYTPTPSRNKKKLPDSPWKDAEYLALANRKNQLYAQFKLHCNNTRIEEDYKACRNALLFMRRKKRSTYYADKLGKGQDLNKNIWKVAKELLSNSPLGRNNSIKLTLDGKQCETEEIPSVFNNYFSQVVPKLMEKRGHVQQAEPDETLINLRQTERSTPFHPTTTDEIKLYIKKLKNKNNKTSDEISSKLLKDASEELSPIISNLINLSFAQKKVPRKVKIARVIPVFKNGSKDDCSNYRPISVLPPISKIMEMAVRARLLNFLELSKFFMPQQYGFRANTNTETAAADMVIKLQDSLDKNMVATGVFVDLAKAFDTISHPLLIYKLRKAGIHEDIVLWLKSYLEERYQYTDVNGIESDQLLINFGVPQGSILGPLLFIMFINDIQELKLHGSITLFADDTSLFYFGNDLKLLEIQMEEDLNTLTDWLRKSQLFMNLSKTVYMIFSKPSKRSDAELNIKIGKEKINRVDNVKFLGLVIDETLKWEHHINYITKKIGSLSGVLYRLRSILPKDNLKSIYYGLIQSNLAYMSLIWGTATNTRLNPLQRLQNRIIKQIFGLDFRHPSRSLYSDLQLLTIRSLTSQAAATFAYLVTNNKRISQSVFQQSYQIHNYNTRNQDKLRPTPSNSTRYGLLALNNYCIHIFNSLPDDIRKEGDTKKFKIKLKNYLLLNPLL